MHYQMVTNSLMAASVHHGVHQFNQCPVQPFGNTVVLRCVVHGHPALSTLRLKVLHEFGAQVLSTARVLKSGPVRSFCLFRKDQDQDRS